MSCSPAMRPNTLTYPSSLDCRSPTWSLEILITNRKRLLKIEPGGIDAAIRSSNISVSQC